MTAFRFSNADPNRTNGPWSEKIAADKLRQNDAAFAALGFLPYTKKWYHGNQPQLNGKGYAIRLFLIETETVPAKDTVAAIGRYICELINDTPGNDTTVSLADPFFWLGEFSRVGASEAFGHEESLKMIVAEAGVPPNATFFEDHRELIQFHYHEQSMTLDVASFLHAPIDQVRPDLRVDLLAEQQEQQEQADGDLGEQEDMEEEEDGLIVETVQSDDEFALSEDE
jgi:hypothetical protein